MFDFRKGAYGESVSDIAAVTALDFIWAWDEAPSMELRIANAGNRRANHFAAHDRWEVYIGLGALPASPTFIGFQSPFHAPEYDEETLRLTIYGYTARMRELAVIVDNASFAGMDAMAAVRDNLDADGSLTTAALVGSNPPSSLPIGSLAKSASVKDRLSLIQAILPFAFDTTSTDRPLPLHFVEAPNGTTPTVLQKTQLDPTNTSPSVAAVLTQAVDFFRIRRQFDQDFFTHAIYKNGENFAELDYGVNGMAKIYSRTVYDDRESARRALQAARIPHYTYEVDLATWNLDIMPGSVVEIAGTKGPADGYHQVRESRHSYRRDGFGHTIRLAAKAPL